MKLAHVLLLFVSPLPPPYFVHGVSCVMLNVDWTPLFVT